MEFVLLQWASPQPALPCSGIDGFFLGPMGVGGQRTWLACFAGARKRCFIPKGALFHLPPFLCTYILALMPHCPLAGIWHLIRLYSTYPYYLGTGCVPSPPLLQGIQGFPRRIMSLGDRMWWENVT